MRAVVAMRTDIDGEAWPSWRRNRVRRRRAGRARPSPSASRRHLTPLAPGTKPRSRPPTREAAVWRTAKPFQSAVTAPTEPASLAALARTPAPSLRESAPWPTMIIGCAPSSARRRSLPLPSTSSVSVSVTAAEIIIVVAQLAGSPITPIGKLPRRQRLRMRALRTEASKRGLAPMISSASASSMPCDRRVEEVACTAERRIECCAILAAVDVGSSRATSSVPSAHTFPRRKRDRRQSRRSCRRVVAATAALMAAKASFQVAGCRRPSLLHIGPVETLGLQAVPDEAGLVGNPLLVDLFVDARHDAHHFAAAGIDADRRADGIHDVDRFGLVRVPTGAR